MSQTQEAHAKHKLSVAEMEGLDIEREDITRIVLDALFRGGGGPECANILVRHQVESFNEFLDKKLVQIIQGFNPIQVCHNYSADASDFRYKMFLNVLRPSLAKPMYQTNDGASMLMTPHMARINNLTYACSLYVDIHIITEVINTDGVTERNETTINGVCLGKIPIMIRSKACVLSQMPTLADGFTTGESDKNECRFDYGGYFVVNGNEKVVISQDRISENKTLVFAPNGNGDGLNAEIRSMPDLVFLPPKTTSLHMAGKPNHMGHVIRLNASFLRSEIPLFVMFRALGIESDRDIYAHIVLDLDSKKNQRIIAELAACAEDACDVHTQEDALNVIKGVLGTTGTPKEYLEQPGRNMEIIKTTMRNDFLSHTGPSFKKKALYVGYMVRKLLAIHLGYQEYDNRDSYLNKRIDTPGILYANLFRQCYGKLIKDVRNLVVRELNLWRATPNVPMQLLTSNNIHRFFKQTVIESGLRYALSTGNWGVKSIGSFQNIRQGVAQVLNRMSYLSMLSHLRRISTPMEKNGKLVQPRKLVNTQWGMVCPAECFAPDTPILLWDGTIKYAKYIGVGDYLIDDNGNSIKVRSTCSGFKTMYDIIPTKKNFMKYTVTDNHILTLKVKRYKSARNFREVKELCWFDKKELKYRYKYYDNEDDLRAFESTIDDDNVIDITIEQYLSLPKIVQNNLYTFKSSGINWEKKEVALDPYILGMWLGDGLSSGYGFATADKELLDKWIEWGNDNDATVTHGLKYKYHIISTINNTQPGIACNKTERAPLKKLLEVYDLVNNKHIPLDYLVNDRKTRLAVLAGIIDTDGNVRANGHEVRICQGEKNYKIIYDTEFLARSLGFSCHLNDGTCSYTVNGEKRHRPYKELTITGEYLYEIPTLLPRKKLNKFENELSAKKCSSYLQSRFQLIKKDVEPFVGWQVEGSGRFLLADMSILHNTPEGAPVGLVKNMSMSTHITNNTSSALIRDMLEEMGVRMYNDTVIDSVTFLRRMGSLDCVSVMVNGDIVGFHETPKTLYDELKHNKVVGSIPPKTSIIWDIPKNIISLSTECGRLCRPLYVACGGRGDEKMTLKIASVPIDADTLRFDDLIYETGAVEYMDVEEIDKAMVAMYPSDLDRGIKGTSLPPMFTHCEIHPSLILGVLAANIPFMNHNQSPRNCYQCLWVEEPVLLVSGEIKKIKDIRVGDPVMSFNVTTGELSNTRVVAHVMHPASKPMCRVTTISGRSIAVTTDHKFMTANGWADSTIFNKSTKIGIHYTAISPTLMDTNLYNSDTLTINGYKFQNSADTDLVKARMLGYYNARPSLGFDSMADEDRYNSDAILIGFDKGYRCTEFLKFISELPSPLIESNENAWIGGVIMELIKAAYFSGYVGGITNTKDPMYSEFGQSFGISYNRKRHTDTALQAEYTRYLNVDEKDKEAAKMSWDDWMGAVEVRGDLLMIPVLSKIPLPKIEVSDITVESDNHSFIGGDGFAVSNSAMGKQAVGIYASNFNSRSDTMAHVLHYPQKPLVRTQLSKYTNVERLSSGINCIVAIMTHTGFNQEDSVMVNESAIDRGLFASTYYKSYRDQCSKNHSTGEEEVFMKPVMESSGAAVAGDKPAKPKPFNYDKLGDNGFVPKDTYVDSNDILVGKVMPHKVHGNIQYRDTSMQIKGNDDGHVDMNYVGTNGDGYKFCKVRLRKYRRPGVGDKLASTHAQKGTIGMVYKDCDMPFTKDGIRPDIIMNPHAVPSRMTIAQLMECIMGKAACSIGACGDSTPFTSCSVKSITDELAKSGYEKYGNEILYNGRTGQQIQTEIFIGPTNYQRLKHMVADKCHCLTLDHEILTDNGWVQYSDIVPSVTRVATLVGKALVYQPASEVLYFPEYEGDMYHISNTTIDLDVTAEHRMWVSKFQHRGGKYVWSPYGFELAKNIVGKAVKYKKDAIWPTPDMPVAELEPLVDSLDLNCVSELFLPDWVWKLSASQADMLMRAIVKGDPHMNLHTVSKQMADDVMRLCIHAGWSGIIRTTTGAEGVTEYTVVTARKAINPSVNMKLGYRKRAQDKQPEPQDERVYAYKGPVYCLTVPGEVFMVRKNGKAVWTGNSRASNGPIVLLTRQPAEGRARNGGLRFGEMERDGIVGHGASLFLKERMLDVSDNFRVFPCRKCGLISVANPEKNIYHCGSCRISADITQVRIPYSMKLLMQELESMGVAPRMMF